MRPALRRHCAERDEDEGEVPDGEDQEQEDGVDRAYVPMVPFAAPGVVVG